MADYEEYLRSAGLSKRGAAVYVALLQAGVSSPSEISRTAKVKRSTVYNIIEELERAGLVAEVPREKRKKYVAKKHHNVSHLKEFGIIFLNPIAQTEEGVHVFADDFSGTTTAKLL